MLTTFFSLYMVDGVAANSISKMLQGVRDAGEGKWSLIMCISTQRKSLPKAVQDAVKSTVVPPGCLSLSSFLQVSSLLQGIDSGVPLTLPPWGPPLLPQ